MRAVLGSRTLAGVCGRNFAYTWPTGPHFGARLNQLWEVSDPEVPSWWSHALSLRYPYRDESLNWIPAAEHEAVWQIRTPHAIRLPSGAPPWTDGLHRLCPVPDLAERIESFHRTELGAAPYLGVMLRMHPAAHAQTLSSSPMEWFVRRVSEIRSSFPQLQVFVSADTEDGQRALLRSLPHCVAQHNKGTYNSTEALRSSIVDLYLLAGSVHIIGAHYSSFPELAQQLAGHGLGLETPRAPRPFGQDALSQPLDPLRPHLRQAVSL